jgi:hypothetical protein
MQSGHLEEDFTTFTGCGELDHKRFALVSGLAALSFLFFGAAELLLFFTHSHFQSMQSIVIAAVSFGLCILTLKLRPALS